MTDANFDLVILGAGSGGYAAALRAAELGQTVALIEKNKVGGICLNWGCIPTKAYLHAAEVADSARESAQFGIHATIDKIDLAGVRIYADAVVNRLYSGLSGLVRSRGITLVPGVGRLLITHVPPWSSREVAVVEARATYDGPVEAVTAGATYDI